MAISTYEDFETQIFLPLVEQGKSIDQLTPEGRSFIKRLRRAKPEARSSFYQCVSKIRNSLKKKVCNNEESVMTQQPIGFYRKSDLVLYTDPKGFTYCFSLDELQGIVDFERNPVNMEPLTPEFLDQAKKILSSGTDLEVRNFYDIVEDFDIGVDPLQEKIKELDRQLEAVEFLKYVGVGQVLEILKKKNYLESYGLESGEKKKAVDYLYNLRTVKGRIETMNNMAVEAMAYVYYSADPERDEATGIMMDNIRQDLEGLVDISKPRILRQLRSIYDSVSSQNLIDPEDYVRYRAVADKIYDSQSAPYQLMDPEFVREAINITKNIDSYPGYAVKFHEDLSGIFYLLSLVTDNLEIAKIAIGELGVNYKRYNRAGERYPLLLLAIKQPAVNIALFLIHNGASLEDEYFNGSREKLINIIIIISSHLPEEPVNAIAEALLNKGAPFDLYTLKLAMYSKNYKVAEMLLKKLPEKSKKESVAVFFFRGDDYKALKRLKKAGLNLDSTIGMGLTALYAAIEKKKFTTAMSLIKAGINVNKNASVFLAILDGKAELVEAMLKHGLDTSLKYKLPGTVVGLTVLPFAVKVKADKNIIKDILEKSRKKIPDADKKFAIEIAGKQGRLDVVDMIRKSN